MEIWIPYVILTFVWSVMAASVFFLPDWTRQGVSFGLNVPPRASGDEALAGIRRAYRRRTMAFGGAWFALSLGLMALGSGRYEAAVLLIGTFGYLLTAFGFYVQAYRHVQRLRQERGWEPPVSRFVAADLSAHPGRTGLPVGWYAVILCLIAINAAWIGLQYDRIPDVLDVHYNRSGQVDRTAVKTFLGVFAMTFIQIALTGFMALIHLATARGSQRLDPDRPQQSSEAHAAFKRKTQAFLFGVTVAIVAEFGVVQLGIVGLAPMWSVVTISIVAPVLIVAGAFALAASSMAGSAAPAFVHPNDDDRFWKAGLFYHNSADPSLLVEKRVGIGWTINLGHRFGWLALLAPLFLVGIIVVISIFAY